MVELGILAVFGIVMALVVAAMAEAERILAASLTKRQERDLCHSRRSRLTDRHHEWCRVAASPTAWEGT